MMLFIRQYCIYVLHCRFKTILSDNEGIYYKYTSPTAADDASFWMHDKQVGMIFMNFDSSPRNIGV